VKKSFHHLSKEEIAKVDPPVEETPGDLIRIYITS
jgi:hypothetical protein